MIYYTYYCARCSTSLAQRAWTPPLGKIVEVGAPDERGGFMVVLFTKVSGEPSHIDPIGCPGCGAPIHRVPLQIRFGYGGVAQNRMAES